jgi:hypothetical protein
MALNRRDACARRRRRPYRPDAGSHLGAAWIQLLFGRTQLVDEPSSQYGQGQWSRDCAASVPRRRRDSCGPRVQHQSVPSTSSCLQNSTGPKWPDGVRPVDPKHAALRDNYVETNQRLAVLTPSDVQFPSCSERSKANYDKRIAV